MAINISINKGEELTKGEKKVLESLKEAYSRVQHEVYIYVQSILSGKRPDLIIIDEKRGISIVEIKDWSADYVKEVSRCKVKLIDRDCENPIAQVRGYKNILCSALFSKNFTSIEEDSIAVRVIFTNMTEESRCNERLELLFKSTVKYLFKNDLKKLDLNLLFEEDIHYTDEELKMIRIALFPEVEIVSVKESKKQSVGIKALDFEQENFAKNVPWGHYMVTGVPGSGKTVILLARAVYLVQQYPDWKILILTYNKSLNHKLNAQLAKIAENFKNEINHRNINIENIEIRHFHSVTNQLLRGSKKPEKMDLDKWYNEEVVNIAMKNAREIYDAILIDEYQDFRMNWIQLCIQLCKEYTLEQDNRKVKNIFLAGDRLQSIYNNKELSWKSIGLNMQGRSKLLKTSYRSAKQHMELALEFLKNDKTLSQEVNKFYRDGSGDNHLDAIGNGSVEFISGNLNMIGDKICELKAQGYKNEDFLILGATNKYCLEIKDKSTSPIKYEMDFVKNLDMFNIQDNIILTTYQSSKGLEAKVVFLTAVDKIYVGNDQNDQLKRKSIYVGMTRASEKLFIHSELNAKGLFVKELEELYYNQNNRDKLQINDSYNNAEEDDGFMYDKGNYPDWLGGYETEEEFWEHTD